MATIIIQGSKPERDRLRKGMELTFKNVKTMAQVQSVGKGESDGTTVLDVYFERVGRDEFTREEIELAMACHCAQQQRCNECPYRREPDCTERLLMDASIYVARLGAKVTLVQMPKGEK